jgi:hippurate hydrolase
MLVTKIMTTKSTMVRMQRDYLGALLGMVIACGASKAFAINPTADRAEIDRRLATAYPTLDALYKDIHAHPELAMRETHTANVLANKIRALGFTVTEKVGGTGVVAIFRNGAGPTVMVRTELDALPMEEKSGLPFASRVQSVSDGKATFVAHTCGHDIHMVSWLGAAQALVGMKAKWHGTLMFIAQPAEETGRGAKAMIADGLFTRFPKPDYGFAVHVWPSRAGAVYVKDGVSTSNSDTVQITFKGRGGHGAIPSAAIDPIVMGAHFVSDVQTVVSRQKDANTFGVVTVGSFQSGSVGNIIPDDATLKLSLRSFTPEVRILLLEGVTRTANAVASMALAPAPIIETHEGASSVVNDHELAVKATQVLTAAKGDKVYALPATAPGWSPSEDYSAFVEAGVPSLFYMVGAYDAKTIADYDARHEPLPTNHSPYFAPDPAVVIPTAVRTLALSALMVLER